MPFSFICFWLSSYQLTLDFAAGTRSTPSLKRPSRCRSLPTLLPECSTSSFYASKCSTPRGTSKPRTRRARATASGRTRPALEGCCQVRPLASLGLATDISDAHQATATFRCTTRWATSTSSRASSSGAASLASRRRSQPHPSERVDTSTDTSHTAPASHPTALAFSIRTVVASSVLHFLRRLVAWPRPHSNSPTTKPSCLDHVHQGSIRWRATPPPPL